MSDAAQTQILCLQDVRHCLLRDSFQKASHRFGYFALCSVPHARFTSWKSRLRVHKIREHAIQRVEEWNQFRLKQREM